MNLMNTVNKCKNCTNFYELYNPVIDGKVGKFYVDANNGNIYIWNGTEYINSISPIHTNQVSSENYIGTQLPLTSGVTQGDTTTVKFLNGFFGNFTWNGTTWVKNHDDYHSIITTDFLAPLDLIFKDATPKDFVIELREINGKSISG